MSLEVWAYIRTYAKARAEKKYPHQPERARHMADHECGVYNGPYSLEPLTLWQRIEDYFFEDTHTKDITSINFSLPELSVWRKFIRFFKNP
jgi:hypothetical protein